MKFRMQRYECKFKDKRKWEEVSELDMLGDLIECYNRVSPVLQEIFNGKHILTPKAVYRLKLD